MVSFVKSNVLRDLETCSFSILKEPGKDPMWRRRGLLKQTHSKLEVYRVFTILGEKYREKVIYVAEK